MKSLVIEDEPDTSRYICNGLKEAGHAVTCCDNGLDGLHCALSETWDLIIIDRLLPGGVDGLSIVGKLPAQASAEFAAVAAQTGTGGAMIEKAYLRFIPSAMQEKLAALKG